MENNNRLASLDVFRGFDMMFIMGLYDLCVGIVALFGITDQQWGFLAQFYHVQWNGFHFIDSIFPTFLFIAGVSFPFSLAKSRLHGMPEGRIWLKTLRRGLLLTLLGLVYNGCLTRGLDGFRFASVLQRIGIGWMLAGFIFLALRGWKARFTAFLAVLLGWWALMQFVSAPRAPAGIDLLSLENVQWNIAVWIDKQLPYPLCPRGAFDQIGVFTHIGGVATALIGMLTGDYLLRSSKAGVAGERQCVFMWIASAVLLAVGWLMIWAGTPCIKKLWTSSYVCCVGAYSLAAFALFYWLIDVKGWWRHTLFFRVIGMNAITVYLAQKIFGLWDRVHGPIAYFIGHAGDNACGLCGALGPSWGVFAWGVIYFAALWFGLYWLYRKGIFLKV